ncbi:hypothetical protein RMSM_03109 [Rhodopirellula maiorica SM1]|uniref:Uncharacterized protein n=1 Tax=Rhodopirellula maiorica SM1 TaxID=1265738 RepID=M5S1A5_9BACT|nr:hypothetical protein RMSM_03109 [Rhodopirellula maiorica SM1]
MDEVTSPVMSVSRDESQSRPEETESLKIVSLTLNFPTNVRRRLSMNNPRLTLGQLMAKNNFIYLLNDASQSMGLPRTKGLILTS